MGFFGEKEKCWRCKGDGYTITDGRDSSDGNTWKHGCSACGGRGSELVVGTYDAGIFGWKSPPNTLRKGSGWVAKKK